MSISHQLKKSLPRCTTIGHAKYTHSPQIYRLYPLHILHYAPSTYMREMPQNQARRGVPKPGCKSSVQNLSSLSNVFPETCISPVFSRVMDIGANLVASILLEGVCLVLSQVSIPRKRNGDRAPMIPVLRLVNSSLKEARLLLVHRLTGLVLVHLTLLIGERMTLRIKICANPGLQSPNPNPIRLLHLILKHSKTSIKDQSATLICLALHNQNKPIPSFTNSQTHIPFLFSLFPNLTLTVCVLLTVVHLVLHTPYAYKKRK